MGTVYYHTPFIRIRPARCRINASNPPGRYYFFEENFPEYVEEQWSEEEIGNSDHEHTFAAEEDIGGTSQFSSDLHGDDSAESDFVSYNDYDDGISDIASENIEVNCDDTAESGFEPGDSNSSIPPEEPANVLDLIPTLYWNYPYIRPGCRVYQQDQNL
jgi:hypothetical protein